jgi:hypothetical protein
MDAVVVSLPDSDYLYVVIARHDIVMGYKLCGPGNAIPIGRFIQQGEKITNVPTHPTYRFPFEPNSTSFVRSSCISSTHPLWTLINISTAAINMIYIISLIY